MTQASSNKGVMLHNAKTNIKDNFKLMIVIFALHFAAVPMLLITAMTKIFYSGSPEDIDAFFAVAGLSTCLAAGAGMLCVLSIFKYLYNKSYVDMKLSLPMTTGQRFVSDFFSGLFVYIVPFFAAEIFTWILMLIGHSLCDGKDFTYFPAPDAKPYTWTCTVFERFFPYLWRGMLGGLLLMMMFYTVTVLVTSCCGSLFEGAAYNILLNFLVPFVVFSVIENVCDRVQGLDSRFYIIKIVPYLGPFGGAYGVINILEELEYPTVFKLYSILGIGKWALIYTLVTAAAGFLTYFVYKKRKAEDTGKPVVYPVIYHIVMTFGVFFVAYTGLNVFDGNYAPIVFSIVICYMTMHIIRNRGFSHVFRGIAVCAITTIVAIGSYTLIRTTGSFGAGEYVPEVDKVASVTMSYNGNIYSQNGYGSGRSGAEFFKDNAVTLTDPDEIGCVLSAHRALTESDDYTEYFMYSREILLSYKLKSGRTVYRRYDSISSEAIRYFSALDGETALRESRANETKSGMLRLKDLRDSDNAELARWEGSSDRVYHTVELDPRWRYSDGNYGSGRYADTVMFDLDRLPEDFIDRIADCLYEDILNEPEEEINTPSKGSWILSIMQNGFTVKGSYERTIAYLRSCGFEEMPQLSRGIAASFISRDPDSGRDPGISICSTELIEDITGEDYFIVPYGVPARGFRLNNINLDPQWYSYVYSDSDELYELLSNSYKTYKTDKNCYTISVNGNSAVIPEEYSETAEKVFIRSVIERAAVLEANGFWEEPEGSIRGSNEAKAYSLFLNKFISHYGRDRIVSAVREIEGFENEADAQAVYDELLARSQTDTDIYGQFR